MLIQGFFYEKNSSRRSSAYFKTDQTLCQVLLDDIITVAASIESLQISQRLGNTPRQIRFENGSMFETLENEEVDAWLNKHKWQTNASFLHLMESKIVFLIPLLLLALSVAWVTYTWGLPKAAKLTAFSLPAGELSIISNQTMNTLDKTFLQKSNLEEKKKQKIQQRFQKLTSEVGSGFKYQLYFRSLNDDEANAFALPDGSIVLLDGLVNLSEDPWEVDSVLLHEIAHVEQRHGLQMVFQDTLITLMVSLMLGDAVSTGDAVISLPALLVQNQYSQQFEQSSDDFASDYMLRHNVDTVYFSRILAKLVPSTKTKNEEPEDKDTIDTYFSSHPLMQERISRINEKIIRNP